MLLCLTSMIETFYLHLEFENKNGQWSINLPFLCTKCGVCCTLEDFLTAGEITGKPEEHPQIHARNRVLFEHLGKIFEVDEAKYDNYIANTPCPFLVNKVCSIYEIRPGGCRLFPKTAFGMQTRDCLALTQFKKQRSALKKGKICKETYHFTSASSEPIKLGSFTEKQYSACLAKLCRVGITEDELAVFNYFNQKKK
jgi:Fe-S-cluster containining protein